MIDIEKFLCDGWVVVDVPDAELIIGLSNSLERKIREVISKPLGACFLDNIHEYISSGGGMDLSELHFLLSEYLWESEFSIQFSAAILPILKEIIGLDIMVQYRPFLRIARPGVSKDNFGFHRDTLYGQTPYELAMHIPLMNLSSESAIRVVSGSHRLPEDSFIISDVESCIKKWSKEHQSGKPYAPKNFLLPEGMKTEPVPLKIGQALLFSPALIHGQEINNGKKTRVSIDMRFVNTNAHTTLKVGKNHTEYWPILQSPIEILAQEYFEAQGA
jgi:sporadic carbohydrate cluster 2OG-Fe(II) oxygenase